MTSAARRSALHVQYATSYGRAVSGNEGTPAPDHPRGRAPAPRSRFRDVGADRLLPLLLPDQAHVRRPRAPARGRGLQRPVRPRGHDPQASVERAHRRGGEIRPHTRHRYGGSGGRRDRRVPAPWPRKRPPGRTGTGGAPARDQDVPADRPAGEPGDARPAAPDGLDPSGKAGWRRLRDRVRPPGPRVIDTTLLAFAGVSLLLAVTPGPDMAVVTKNALAHGRRGVVLTTSGIALALAVWVTATAVGL